MALAALAATATGTPVAVPVEKLACRSQRLLNRIVRLILGLAAPGDVLKRQVVLVLALFLRYLSSCTLLLSSVDSVRAKSNSAIMSRYIVACISICVVLIGILFNNYSTTTSIKSVFSSHLLNHPVVVIPMLLDAATQDGLISLAHELHTFGSVTGAENTYDMRNEDIGEGFENPASAAGTCNHPFLLPSKDGKRCILPGRVDVGRHYILTGGLEGRKEQHTDLVSRAQSFIRYLFAPQEYEVTRALFNSTPFLEAARAVCPQRDTAILDTFQASIIIQVPGQTVPAHLDGVWFRGADRFHVPQWLLAVMAFSNLFRERFIHQVQLVAYFAPRGVGERSGGEFTHWSSGKAEAVPCSPGTGNAMDGSKTIHAAAVFQPSASPPRLSKDAVNALVYIDEADEWELRSNGAARSRYASESLRYSVVYRARCFSSERERDDFNNAQRAGEGLLDLETDILGPLKDEAVRRGAVTHRSALDSLSRLELALKLIDLYVEYPVPNVLLPLNYCALTLKFPQSQWLQRFINLICPLKSTIQ
jgi:hypothetical protein